MAGKRYGSDIEALLSGGPMFERRSEDFRPYQTWMEQLVYENDKVLLAAQMGLGKTAAVLRAVWRMLNETTVRRVLVVAPIHVAKDTWPEEIMTWDFSRFISWSLIVGTAAEREAEARRNTEIAIVNRENLVWLYEFWGKRWPYDCVVYDEASRLKGGEEKTKPVARADGTVSIPRMSEFGALRAMRKRLDRVIEMSGTPSPNGLQDLWGPITFLDGGERLGSKKHAFLNRWFVKNPYSKAITPQAHAFAEITAKTKDVMFTLREEDYLTLPPLVKSERWVTLAPAILEKYKRLEQEFVLAEHDVEAVNSGVLANKLLQLSNGSIYNTEAEAQFLHDAKLDELDSIRQEASGEPLLIAYSFKFDVDAIRKRFPKYRVYGEGKNDMKDWNAGKIPGLIIHPASAAHGLNFQYGGSIVVWYGITWSLENYLQLTKRLHRSGQTASRVLMHHILARRTYDERVMKVLREREITQDAITETTRVRMAQILAKVDRRSA